MPFQFVYLIAEVMQSPAALQKSRHKCVFATRLDQFDQRVADVSSLEERHSKGNRPMTQNEFLREIEGILGLLPGTLKGHEKLEDLENWDSTALVSLIAVAESLSNVEITLEQVVSCSTVADLLQLVPLEDPSN